MKRSFLYASLIALTLITGGYATAGLDKGLVVYFTFDNIKVNGFSMNLVTDLMLKLSKTPNLLRVNMGTLSILLMIPKIV